MIGVNDTPIKSIISLFALMLFIGCSDSSSEYRKFTSSHGEEHKFCLDGNIYMEKFLYKKAIKPQRYLIDSQVCTGKPDTY